MSSCTDGVMDTQSDRLRVILLNVNRKALLRQRTACFAALWHAGKVKGFGGFFSCFLVFGSGPCSRCIFCVEHEPSVRDVYVQAVAAQSLSHRFMTPKLARGDFLVLPVS